MKSGWGCSPHYKSLAGAVDKMGVTGCALLPPHRAWAAWTLGGKEGEASQCPGSWDDD